MLDDRVHAIGRLLSANESVRRVHSRLVTQLVTTVTGPVTLKNVRASQVGILACSGLRDTETRAMRGSCDGAVLSSERREMQSVRLIQAW